MIVKWRTVRHLPTNIERVEYARETEKCVYTTGSSGRERKSLKHSDWEQYHDTWADARTYLLDKARCEVEAYEAQLHKSRSKLSQIESLKEPA